MLMAIQFPDDFVVADLIEVEERNLIPGPAGRALLMHRIEVPIYGRAEIEIGVAQQIEAMAADFFGWRE